jgi:hypothetical protein
MQHDRAQEQPERHESAVASSQPKAAAVQKKPFVEPTLSQAVSLLEVTGAFIGTVSF